MTTEKTCRYCEEEITHEFGVGLVHVMSGDDGGTYDFCESSPNGRHRLTDLTNIPNDAKLGGR